MDGRPLLAVLLMILAGCSEPETTTPDVTTTDVPDAPLEPQPVLPELMEFDMSWDGNLGAEAFACAAPIGCQPDDPLTPGDSQRMVEAPGWNLTGANFTVTWSADTPATAEITLGLMVMGTCSGCDSPWYHEVSGTSPLEVEIADLDVGIDEDHVVHAYLYNPSYTGSYAGVYEYASPDQDFTVDGTLSLWATPGTPPPPVV